MTTQILTTGGAAIALTVLLSGFTGSAVAQHGEQNRNDDRAAQYGGSLDARQHGYEHAYRDGADRGRQDRDRRLGYRLGAYDYQNSARGYEGFFGERAEYLLGAREGYKAGYADGYNRRSGQYGQLYGRPSEGGLAPAPNDAYSARSWGSHDMAYDVGYRDGITTGQQDQGHNARTNYRDSDAYRNADLGYQASFGDRNAYRLKFQDGFERGYTDGYGQSRSTTDRGGRYLPNAPNARNADQIVTPGLQLPSALTIAVPGNRQWTATNIRVNEGDTVRFQTTGEVRFMGTAEGRAGAAGSIGQKYVPGAPLPRAFAGALIGRIDNGLPFGIGDQTSLRMPATGTLYLGINDDNVSDNTGQFQVEISR